MCRRSRKSSKLPETSSSCPKQLEGPRRAHERYKSSHPTEGKGTKTNSHAPARQEVTGARPILERASTAETGCTAGGTTVLHLSRVPSTWEGQTHSPAHITMDGAGLRQVSGEGERPTGSPRHPKPRTRYQTERNNGHSPRQDTRMARASCVLPCPLRGRRGGGHGAR